MNLSVNGQSQVPPGFRFHPTEEELLHYYLRKKVAYKKIDLDVIRDVDLNKLEPWDIQEKCKIGSSTPQSDWYFFSHKDKKYPTGTRTNRATTAGFWKATGRDKVIYSSLRRIGMRKTLVFYKGRAPHGQKSDWIMHEYRLELDDTFTTHHDADKANNLAAAAGGGGGGDYSVSEEGWVVCRVFKKKNYHRALEIESPQRQRQSPSTSSMNMDHSRNQLMVMRNSSNDGGIADQILEYMGRSCKQEENETTTTTSNNSNINMPSSSLINIINTVHLPSLEESDTPTILPSSSSSSSLNNKYCYSSPSFFNHHHEEEGCTTTTTTTAAAAAAFKDYGGGGQSMDPLNHHHQKDGIINDWAAFDRLVASQLNGPGSEQDAKDDTSNHLSSCYNYGYRYGDPNVDFCFSIDGHDHDDVVQLSQLPSSSRPNIQSSSSQVQSTEIDLWSFTRSLSSSSSCSDPLCHLSV
ncbi:NAC domain-containing protein 43-like [Camellia sinensis]|uniref:NAC domain-containing protein n=1 Tax=Camellia sinensis var. sinensis TaxID=542762 RepID=A0A4S4DJX5_CAMSN|nr:NAC domain-containing protein 43-like [Camellia sinensis]THG02276.1 hypothetical protein TEA_012247 [Camellia sinensis var. sinensis]